MLELFAGKTIGMHASLLLGVAGALLILILAEREARKKHWLDVIGMCIVAITLVVVTFGMYFIP